MKEAIAYIRVSGDEQLKGYSPAAQRKLILEYAKRNEIQVKKNNVFDVSESARQQGRKAFNEMLQIFIDGDIDILLVEKADRLYRNMKDHITIWDLVESNPKKEIHFVKENEILCGDLPSHKKMYHRMRVIFAENFLDNLREETKKGLLERAEQKLYPGYVPIGYQNKADENEKRVIILDENLAPFVKECFELYATGRYSLKTLKVEMDNRGMRSKKNLKVSRHGYQQILRNPFYYGSFIWGGKLYEGNHTPIVTKTLFDQVQNTLGNRHAPRPKSKKNFVYKRVLRCGYCNHAVTAQIQTGRHKKGHYIYYNCSNPDGCKLQFYREKKLDELFKHEFQKMKLENDTKEWIKRALKSSSKIESSYTQDRVRKLNTEYEKNLNKINAAYNDRLDAVISKEMYLAKTNEIEERNHQIKDQLKILEKVNKNYHQQGVMILEMVDNIDRLFFDNNLSIEQKSDFLLLLFSRCILKNDGKIDFKWKSPFDHIVGLKLGDGWGE